MRQIVLDTETTGIRVEEGHRVIEIGCVELVNRRFTGKHFHYYINPEREVEAGAFAVHGISNEFLSDKPLFHSIADEFMNFISGAELIIHNAPFDVAFLNNELVVTKVKWKDLATYCRITDTLQMARKMHVGQRNSLDALCKRYSIDNSKREFHGALMDAHLLAQVYLSMTGGQGSFFDSLSEAAAVEAKTVASHSLLQEKHSLLILKADDAELAEHENYLQMLQKKGKCVWLEEDAISSSS